MVAGGTDGSLRRALRVKICGVCRPVDAAAAVEAGAHYVGVILAAGFARTRSSGEAAEIYAAAEGALRVGVFVDDDASSVIAAADRLRLDVVQLHGVETIETVVEIGQAGGRQLWKAIRPRDERELVRLTGRYSELVDGVLVEGVEREVGLRQLCPDCDIIVAGGLRPGDVGEIVRLLGPDVVDVSSGVEESLGIKSAVSMRAFVDAARAASAQARAS